MVRVHGLQILGIESKTAFTSVFLVVNPFIWYYAVIIFLQNTLRSLSLNNTDSALVWGVHFSGIIFAALAGASLTKRIDKRRFLTFWMIFGVISSLVLSAISTSVPVIVLVALVLGVSLGLGMPACMTYYTECVPVEKRGRISGVVMLITGVGLFIFGIFPFTSPIMLGIVLGVWRLSSVLVFHLSKPSKEAKEEKREDSSYKTILGQQSFVLYLIPWIMLSLVNYLGSPTQVDIVGRDTVAFMSIIRNLMMGVFAIIGGFLLDFVGRKRIAISGFVMLGIDAATLGLFPSSVWANYFSATVDGIALGFLLVIFIVTIWGDLSNGKSSSKYYAIGVLPFFVSKLLELTIGKDISLFIVQYAGGTNGLFSFLAFYLFLAILPLVYAPETLPEKLMKDRDLKSYTEKALKQAQKDAGKSQKKDSDEAEESPEDEEARKLAEKYY